MASITQYRFKPNWLPTILMLLMLPLLIALGMWQLQRANEKCILLAEYAQRQLAQPLDWQDLTRRSTYRYYPVLLPGKFDNEHVILLDNKVYQGQVGYQVLTPLLASNGRQAILINRGWIPVGASRQQLPELPAVADTVHIAGFIQDDLSKPFTLANTSYEQLIWPLRIQYIDLEDLQAALGYELLPMVIMQAPDNPHGFMRDWQVTTMLPAKHRAYAFQWFALAFTLVVLYIILSTRTTQSNNHD